MLQYDPAALLVGDGTVGTEKERRRRAANSDCVRQRDPANTDMS